MMNKEEIDYWLKLFSDNNYAFMSKDGKKITLFKVFDKLKKLQQENQELKKQLKDKTEDYKRMKDNFDSKVDVLTEIDTQQKEFIKYLEDDLKEKYRDMGYRHNIFREILRKYKSIIGVSDDNKTTI